MLLRNFKYRSQNGFYCNVRDALRNIPDSWDIFNLTILAFCGVC